MQYFAHHTIAHALEQASTPTLIGLTLAMLAIGLALYASKRRGE